MPGIFAGTTASLPLAPWWYGTPELFGRAELPGRELGGAMAGAAAGGRFVIRGLGVGSGSGAAQARSAVGGAALVSSPRRVAVVAVRRGADLVELLQLRQLLLALEQSWEGWLGSRRSERRGRPWASSRAVCAGWRSFPPG